MASLVGFSHHSSWKTEILLDWKHEGGELILQLVDQGAQNDLCGELAVLQRMMVGLGWQPDWGVAFYDDQGHLLRPMGTSLGRVARIDTSAVPKALEDIELRVLTDVIPLWQSRSDLYLWWAKLEGPLLFPTVDQTMQDFLPASWCTNFVYAWRRAGWDGCWLGCFCGGQISSG